MVVGKKVIIDWFCKWLLRINKWNYGMPLRVGLSVVAFLKFN